MPSEQPLGLFFARASEGHGQGSFVRLVSCRDAGRRGTSDVHVKDGVPHPSVHAVAPSLEGLREVQLPSQVRAPRRTGRTSHANLERQALRVLRVELCETLAHAAHIDQVLPDAQEQAKGEDGNL